MADNLRASIIPYPLIEDPRGNLGFLELGKHIPFEVRRLFYIRDIPLSARRGGHAHRMHEELILVLSGSISFRVDDGHEALELSLAVSDNALYLPRMSWIDFSSTSENATCIVLASDIYNEADYIRNYDEFLALARP